MITLVLWLLLSTDTKHRKSTNAQLFLREVFKVWLALEKLTHVDHPKLHSKSCDYQQKSYEKATGIKEMITSFMKLLIVKQILLVSAIGKYKENSVENLNASFRVERESHLDRFFNYQKSDKRPSKVYEFHIGSTDLKF